MPSTYTTNGGIELPANGEQSGTWGETVNDNMAIIDRLTNGVGGISLSGATHTLTTADGALSDGQYNVLVLGGSPSGTNTITISPNDGEHVYVVKNASGQTATFTQGSGANVSVLNNTTKIIYADGSGSGAAVVDITGALDLGSLIIAGTAVTATAAELNILDGVTATAAELNILDGVTSTTAELNILDGVTATAAELNILDGVTATAAELNYNDITTLGTVQASKTVTANASGDVLFPDGDVGIGTISPAEKLHVVGTLRLDGDNAGITSGEAVNQLIFKDTDTTTDVGQTMGQIDFATADADAPGVSARISGVADSSTTGQGRLTLFTGAAGTLSNNITMAAGSVVINEAGADMDFRVESDTNTHALFVQGSDGYVGIGTSSPSTYGGKLSVVSAASTQSSILMQNPGQGSGHIGFSALNSNIKIYNCYATGLLDDGAGIDINTSGDVSIGVASANNSRLRLDNAGTSGAPQLMITATGAGSQSEIRHDTSNNLIFDNWNGSSRTERMKLDSSGNFAIPPSYNHTTGSGANVFIRSDGYLQRSTSSLKYKNTVEDAPHGLTELLTLRPVTYKSNTDGDTVFGGLIAEEVHDAGLTEFVQYNDDGEPDALAYGNMVSLCIKALQEQQAIITALETRLSALEG
jgi:hypothetical protein